LAVITQKERRAMDVQGVVFPEPEHAPAQSEYWQAPFLPFRKGRGDGPSPAGRTIPSFFQRLEAIAQAGIDLSSTRAASLVPEREAVAFLRRHALERDARGAISAHRTSYVAEVHRGLLDRVWSMLKAVVTVDRDLKTGVRIPIAELHVPRVAGCHSRYVASHGESDDVSFSVAARGVGAGGGLVASVVATQGVETSEECLLITVPVDIVTTTYSVPALDRSLEIVTVSSVYEDIGTKRFEPPFEDPCAADYLTLSPTFLEQERSRTVARNVDFDDHPVPVGLVTKSREVKRERRFLMSIPDLLDVETRFVVGVSYEFKLVSSRSYLGYYEERQSAKYYWSW
jgi:hypothetical protein